MAFRFTHTKHADEQLKLRNIEVPKGKVLCAAGRKTRQMIRNSCKGKGYDSEYIYLMNRNNGKKYPIVVYVCKQTEIGVLLLITAFKYEKKGI